MAREITKTIDKAHYIAEAIIIWCSDARFSELLYDFVKTEDYLHPDIIRLEGGAKALADKDFRQRDLIISQIEHCINLHRVHDIVLMTHADCEAYDKSFQLDNEEMEFYTTELKRAKEALIFALGNVLSIQTFYADFYGLTEYYF
jgi:hypothetical protein